MAEKYCMFLDHKWVETYYGYRCENCDEFIPYGCEPWAYERDDEYRSDEYYPDDDERDEDIAAGDYGYYA